MTQTATGRRTFLVTAAPRPRGHRSLMLPALFGAAFAFGCGAEARLGSDGGQGGRDVRPAADAVSDGAIPDDGAPPDGGANDDGKDGGKREAGVCPMVAAPAASTTTPCGAGGVGTLPAGYVPCGGEGATCVVPQLSHVAYGANGSYVFRYNVTGSIVLSNSTFGDPAPGVPKMGYYKIVDQAESTAALSTAMAHLQRHLLGCTPLSAGQLNQQRLIIDEQARLLGNEPSLIQLAVDVVQTYESTQGPIFVNAKTPPRFPKCSVTEDGLELDRAVFSLQQGLHDALHADLLEAHPELFDGVAYGTAAYFPGAVAPPADPTVAYTVSVNASMPKDWGRPTMSSQNPLRRPTGFYLAPGSVGKVTVPPALVSKGYQLLVGAHTLFKGGRERFEQVSKSYPITKTVTRIANPFGGGIYLVVPYEANAGVVGLGLTNVVRSPYFAKTSVRTTTLQEWTTMQRTAPGAWADFETDKFMMQVPTNWISNFADPVALMAKWDKSMDGVSELLGYPLVRNNVVLYVHPDVSIAAPVYAPGYPQVNNDYDPRTRETGNKDHWLLKNDIGWSTEFHELGHAQLFPAFNGETESSVHLLFMYAHNVKFGADLDTAASMSCPLENQRAAVVTRAQVATSWMVRENFRLGRPMDISGNETNEVRYQLTGQGKYWELAALFGWDALKTLYLRDNMDREAGVTPNDGLDDGDRRILKLSTFAGVDLRPLIHFWGYHPANPTALASAIAAAALPASRLIYDRLLFYKTLIPMNNTQFNTHYASLYPTRPAGGDPDYGYGWYNVWRTQYDASHGTAAAAALDAIVARYFPAGRPVGN